MSNSTFFGISNTARSSAHTLQTISDSKSVKTGYQTHSIAGVLTPTQLVFAKDKTLLVDASGSNDLQLGADTAATARGLMSTLGLAQAGAECLLRFLPMSTPAADVDLLNTSSSYVHVRVSLAGSVADTQVAFNSSTSAGAVSGAECIVLATATTVTAGAEVITFTILQQSAFNA